MYYYQVLFTGKKLLGSIVNGNCVIKCSDPIRTEDDIFAIKKIIRRREHLRKCEVTKYLKLTNDQYKSCA